MYRMAGKLDIVNSLVPYSDIEEAAYSQLLGAATSGHALELAVMPDIHAGYSLPIGVAALLDGHVCPAYVGYDIGCGMATVYTNMTEKDWRHVDTKAVRRRVLREIPVGVGGQHKESVLNYAEFTSAASFDDVAELNKNIRSRSGLQIGTLGSGNHFIEFGISENTGLVCVTVHTGSRGIGHSCGEYWMKKAVEHGAVQYHGKQKTGFLAGALAEAYMHDVRWMERWAFDSRRFILKAALDALGLNLGFGTMNFSSIFGPGTKCEFENSDRVINVCHNHVEEWKDKGTFLHRKGCTDAADGRYGVIPGSMASGVYVTQGLGNDDYLCSSSHGAGRKMSRAKAKESISMDAFKKAMAGIDAEVTQAMVDEAPFAYKDIHGVIVAQEGIVIRKVDHIRTVMNIKG